jgi:Rod binding domain-containing protein
VIAISDELHELANLAAADRPEAAARVARDFEAMLLSEMMRFGAKPLFGDSPLDGGSAGRMAREQLFTQLTLLATRGGGLGLARQIEQAIDTESTGEDA